MVHTLRSGVYFIRTCSFDTITNIKHQTPGGHPWYIRCRVRRPRGGLLPLPVERDVRVDHRRPRGLLPLRPGGVGAGGRLLA